MKNYKNLFCFILILAAMLFNNFADASGQNIQIQNVIYNKDLQADLFSTKSTRAVPAIILVHGGYWRAGNRHELSDFAMKLAKNGFLAMTIDYHLLPKYGQQEQTSDVTNAIWWLKENSQKLGVNPSEIGIVGISAGGYLANWAATHDSIDAKGTHSKPNAVVSICGPWNLTAEAETSLSDRESVKLVNSFCCGCDRKTASPQYSISSSVPPILLIHGDADKIVPLSQAVNAYKLLKKEHCKCKLIIMHNYGHFFPNTPHYFVAMNKSVKFLNKTLQK